MSNYNNGKIYKLVSQFTDMIYIGSTVQTLKQRINTHIFETRHNLLNSSKNMFIWGDCQIELIENYPCNSKKELVQREQYYMDLYSDYCINLRKAIGDKKAHCKKYRESEKGRIWIRENREDQNEKRRKRGKTKEYKLKQKQRRQDFKAEKSQSDKKYRENNKEKVAKSKKRYYDYQNSMGGDFRYNNNLSRIDPTLFS